jgi:hypothetical protein
MRNLMSSAWTWPPAMRWKSALWAKLRSAVGVRFTRFVRAALAALAADLGLVATGGSDDHGTQTGDRIGCDTIAPHQYERLVSLATGAVPETGRAVPPGPFPQ